MKVVGDRVRITVGDGDCLLLPDYMIGKVGTITRIDSNTDRPELDELFWVHLDAGGVWSLRENELELAKKPPVEPLRRCVPVRWLVGHWVMAIGTCLLGLIILWLTLDLVIALGACLFIWALYGCYQLYQGRRGRHGN